MITLDRFDTYPQTAALAAGLRALGIPADLYQDGTSGGLLCVIVPLKGDSTSDAEHRDHVLIATEDEAVWDGKGRKWFGGLYLLNSQGEPDETLYDLALSVPQRTWCGETEEHVAAVYAPLLRLLRR